MRILLTTLYIVTSFAAFGLSKDPKYPVSAIPAELKKNANLIFRLDKMDFNINQIDGCTQKVHNVITILNSKQAHRAFIKIGYDKLIKITSLDAQVYDAAGEEIYKLKKSDIGDQSYISGYSLYEDNRVKYVDLRQKDYPYTIDVTYEVKYKYLFHTPSWYVIPGEHISVENSEFTITSPPDLAPRYRELNMEDGHLKKSNNDGAVVYKWQFENLKAVEHEYSSADRYGGTPVIVTSPSRFKFEGYEGDLSSWDGISDWILKLNEGRDVLPESTINEIKDLVSGASTRREKVKVLYQYMQSKTRYVSIQLGIGGYQTFPATTVAETGYGDCKALSNYMYSILKAVDIPSYYTLVYAGSDNPTLMEDFPNTRFNHAILAVPDEADTIWLECTSQINPFDYMGKFTGDRKVLLVTEEGGKIVRTPSYDHENNMIASRVEVKLDEQGNGFTKLFTTYNGTGSEYNGLDYYLTLTDKDRKDWLHENLDISDYELQKYDFTQTKDVIPSIDLEADIIVRKLASVSGKRIFLPLNFLDARSYVPPKLENRKTDVKFSSSSITADTITYTLPANYHVDYTPEETSFEYPFGSYQMKVEMKENQLIYYRKLTLNKGTYSPETYSDVVEFFKQVRTADKKKAVLVNKT